MTARILKHVITSNPYVRNTLMMPVGTHVRAVGVQRPDEVCLWAENPQGDGLAVTERSFVTIPTGGNIPFGGTYIGTVFDGPYVWHVYEVTT